MAVTSYADRRDVLARLGRVHLTGTSALQWLPLLDAGEVRAISDGVLAQRLGLIVGETIYPQAALYPSASTYPYAAPDQPPTPPPPPDPDTDPDVWS